MVTATLNTLNTTLFPVSSLLPHLPTFKTFWQSHLSYHSLTSYLNAALWSYLNQPVRHSRTQPASLSQQYWRQKNFYEHEDDVSLISSQQFSELTSWAPGTFLLSCCRTDPTTFQIITKERWAGTLQAALRLCTSFQWNELYSQGIIVQEHVRRVQSSYQLFLSKSVRSSSSQTSWLLSFSCHFWLFLNPHLKSPFYFL